MDYQNVPKVVQDGHDLWDCFMRLLSRFISCLGAIVLLLISATIAAGEQPQPKSQGQKVKQAFDQSLQRQGLQNQQQQPENQINAKEIKQNRPGFTQEKQGKQRKSRPSPADAKAPITLDRLACKNMPNSAPEMLFIDAGRFQMGRVYEKPRHPLAIVRPFAMSRCEVTMGQFQQFVDETRYVTEAEGLNKCNSLYNTGASFEKGKERHWRSPGFSQEADHPVVCVSWRDTQSYIRWVSARSGVSYRLPSEAEWEYVARAGQQGSRFWGDDPQQACRYANAADQSFQSQFPGKSSVLPCTDNVVFTAPVGSYRRNAFGIADMLGNVGEWTQDCWHQSYQGAPTDGSAWEDKGEGDCSRRVVRGGGWYSTPDEVLSGYRSSNTLDRADNGLGFRLARTL